MTIGIGGWGAAASRCRSSGRSCGRDLTDLTVVSYGGPDVGLLCAAGKVKRAVYAFVSLDSIPLEPHFRAARQAGAIEDEPYDEGMFLLGLQAAAWRVPFLPTRVGLGSDLSDAQRPAAHRRSRRTTTARTFVAVPALELDAAHRAPQPRRRRRQRPVPRARPLLRRPHARAADRQPVHERRADRADGGPDEGGVVPHACGSAG